MTNSASVQVCVDCGERNSAVAKSCAMCGKVLASVQTASSAAPLGARQNALSNDLQALQNSSQLPMQNQLQAPPKSDAPRKKLDTDFMDLGMHIVGGLVFAGGVFLWCGNVFGFFRTFPGVGYITMLIGGGIFKMGSSGF